MKAFFYVETLFRFKYFLLYISLLLILFIILLSFSKTFIYLSKEISSFIIKYLHLVLSTYLLYIFISGKNMHKSLIPLSSFVTNLIFSFTKRKLIGYYYFTNIYIAYWNLYRLLKFVFFNFISIKFYYFFYLFLYMVLIFFIYIFF